MLEATVYFKIDYYLIGLRTTC